MYTIGIDVGGTNTDGALLHQNHVVEVVKVPTDHTDLVGSTTAAVEKLLRFCPQGSEIELQLSTTLTTNTIVEGKGTPTAVLVIPGPGLDLEQYGLDFPLHVLAGYVDHRGRIVGEVDLAKALLEADKARQSGAEALAVVGKFSQRNPNLEKKVVQAVERADFGFSHITMGHQMAGSLGFPRRVVTAYLNSQVAGTQARFAEAVASLGRFRRIRILKADGGTMTLEQSRLHPVETILSGPAASLMAALALTKYPQKNLVVVDIGGTTTDLAVVVEGLPVYARDGAVISGYLTAVPAVFSRSIGLGGDSAVHMVADSTDGAQFRIGPNRAGRPACLGGSAATPTDALVALGSTALGEQSRSIAVMRDLGEKVGLGWQEAAHGVMDAFVKQLCQAIDEVYTELEGMPVYTLAEFLESPSLRPQVVVGLGTPAQAVIGKVGRALDLDVELLPFSASANALGAAAARPTTGITLHVDTALQQLSVPEMGVFEEIRRPVLFDHKRAQQEAFLRLKEYARQSGLDGSEELEIVEDERFNVIRGFRTMGQIFHLKAQVRPGACRLQLKEGLQ